MRTCKQRDIFHEGEMYKQNKTSQSYILLYYSDKQLLTTERHGNPAISIIIKIMKKS